jgi:outer membrane protein assembly factor BamB
MKCWAWATLLVLALNADGISGQGRDPFAIDYDANRVLRRDMAGKVVRATRLDGSLGSSREPDLAWDAERVYVTHGDGVTALDARTGKVVWHTKGPADRMCLSGDLLLATDCTSDGRLLVARATASGKEVFQVRLPAKHFDSLPVEEVAGLFLVQAWDDPLGRGNALLIDRKGEVRYRLDRQVVGGVRRGKDTVLLTSRDVVRLAPGSKTRWAIPLERQWMAGGGLVELPGGDVVAFLYGGICDSGVELVRLDPASGKLRWRASCQSLGVDHSKYRHRAEAAVEGSRLRVTSRGSYGTFVEVRDLRSGKQLERKVQRPSQ